MSKKNVYMVQVDVANGIDNKSAYLPYAVGLLVANAWKDPKVTEAYDFRGFIFRREDIAETAAKMDAPGLVGFSCYCWNTEYNKALAQKIKAEHPDCIIAFGGHNVPPEDDFLRDFPYIDILMHGEGEETFRKLLIALKEGNIGSVPNISYRRADGSTETTPFEAPVLLDEYPSPYLTGLFDEIVADPSQHFNAILETSRGCPHQCAYCDWGLLKSRVRYFSLERVKAEIRWMSEHRIEFVWGADANFGSRPEDMEIVQAIDEAKKHTGHPERMRINYSKNNPERVLEIAQKLHECDLDHLGATLSFQSLSEPVLKAIGRKNLSLDYFQNLVSRYRSMGLKAYSELIIGLPEETYQSFIRGLSTIFELGQHFSFDAYLCCVLPNSIMGQKEYREKYKIRSVDIEMFRPHSEKKSFAEDIKEYYNIVVETSTMSLEECIRASVFYEMVRAFHSFGFLRPFSIYLYYEKGIRYSEFYDHLLDYFKEHPELFISGLYRKVEHHFTNLFTGKEDDDDFTFEAIGKITWQDCEYCTLMILNHFEQFFAEIKPYIMQYPIEADVFEDILNYQKAVIRFPNKSAAQAELHYDVHGFLQDAYCINGDISFKKRANRLYCRDTDVQTNWKDYAQYIIWYGRLSWKANMDDIHTEFFDA